MSAPYRPQEGRPVIPALSPAGRQEPRGGFVAPKQRRCWVRFTDGSWRPCDVLAWARARSIMTDAPYWMIMLRLLVDGTGGQSTGWYVYDAQHVETR